MSLNIKGTMPEEDRLIKAVQTKTGAVANGVVGNQTWSEIVKIIAPEAFPATLEIYGMPVIIGKNIIAFDPDSSLKNYDNAISGSFTYIAGETPCSIMINGGKDVWSSASKAWAGFKESVICKYKDGSVQLHKVKTTAEIPNRKDIVVAVGGMGLLSAYDPKGEGFKTFTFLGNTYNHGDVLRDTNHTVLGVKDGFFYGIYCKSMTGPEVNAFCRDKMKLDLAIMLDGGHIAAINSEGIDINLNQMQGYGIQFVR